ncbi:PIN/TRAM domain-containing protein, partial [Clostridioides difficile]
MIRKVTRILFILLGFTIGITTYLTLMKDFEILTFGKETYGYIAAVVAGIIIAILGYLIEPWVVNKVKEIAKIVDKELSKYPQTDILLGSMGLIVGFVIAYLLSGLVNRIPIVGGILSLLLYLFLGYLGMKVALKSK